MFSDYKKKFLDTLSTFSRYSVDVLFMFSRCSQYLLGLLVLGGWVGLVGRVGFAGLIGWVSEYKTQNFTVLQPVTWKTLMSVCGSVDWLVSWVGLSVCHYFLKVTLPLSSICVCFKYYVLEA